MRRTVAAKTAAAAACTASSPPPSSLRLRRSGKNLGRHVQGSHCRSLATTATAAAGAGAGAASDASASTSASASSSASSPGGYAPPFKPGQSPVYDAAVAYLKEHSKRKEAQIGDVRKQLDEQRAAGGSSASLQQLQQKLLSLEIAKDVSDPETVWRFRHGQGDMSQPVYRYLAEQAWRNNGSLGILMQRLTQMHVITDLLGTFDPDADLGILVEGGEVEPGSYLKPLQTVLQPELRVQVFHPEERLYTLLLVDPDSPDPENDSFKTVLHFASSDIPLSSTSSRITLQSGTTLLPWAPPHPERGTPYHRYTFVLYEQSQSSTAAGPSTLRDLPAAHSDVFDIRSFARENGLIPRAASFFRGIWDEDVTTIFKDQLNREEPRFGHRS